MLAKIVPPTNDFHALARYLVEGATKPPNPDRVAWVFGHNLPTDDPDLAATLMTATAQRSKRCKKAAYHAMIAWAPNERPTPEQMQEIARKTLELAGLGEHQALVMGHGDTPHRHLHMLINRVHPTTGRAWETKHDYALFDRIMRQLSDEHGFRYIPAQRFNPEETADLPKKPNTRATRAAKRGAATDRPQWSRTASRALGADTTERLDRATTWDDLDDTFAEHGLILEAKGTGLVVGNARSYSKFSSLGLAASAKDFEARFGGPYVPAATRPTRPPTRRPLFTVDAVDIVRFLAIYGLADASDVRQAIDDVTATRNTQLAAAPLGVRMAREIKQAMSATSLTPSRRPQPGPAKRPAAKSQSQKDGR